MINFVSFSVRDCLIRCNFSCNDTKTRFLTDELNLVGQQKDGYILVSGKTSEGSTYVAGVDVENKVGKVLTKTTADRPIGIVVCASVSSDQKLLALSVQKDSLPQLTKSQHSGEIFEHTGTYQAFVVRLEQELTNEDLWLPVTICHPTVIHVYFLESLSSDSTAGLLILTHHHSIQLHQIQNIDAVKIVSSQVLAVSFNWEQWLPDQQCLLYVATPSCPERQQQSLSCIQFCGSSQYSTVFNLSTSAIGIKNIFGNNSREKSSISSLNKISVNKLNLDAVIWKQGVVCLCYQSVPCMRNAWKVSSAREEGTEPLSPVTRSRHYSSPGIVDVLSSGGSSWVDDQALESTFTVTLLHHGCQIHSTHRSDRPETLWPMRFIPLDDNQLLVTSPGMPWHLIDVDPNHQPLHHIADDEPFWPFNCKSKVDCVLSLKTGTSLLLERGTCQGFFLTLEAENLISLFIRNNSPRNRTSIVHYLSAHTHQIDNIHKLLVAMQQDVWDIETTTFLQEILIGRTYATTRKKHATCQEVLYHLPFTTISPIDDEDSVLRTSCMYEHLSTDPLLLASSKSDALDIWQLLWHYQKSFRKRKVMTSMNPDLSLQLDLQSIATDFARLQHSIEEPMRKEEGRLEWNGQLPFCFSKLCTLCSRSNQVNAQSPPDVREIVQQIKNPFPVSDPSAASIDLHSRTTHTWKKLNNFLSQSCPSVSSNFLNKIATTFVAEQVCQSNILCNSIFLSCDVTSREDKECFYFLEEMEQSRLQCLSSLSERFLVAAQSLAFPLPDGFSAAVTLMTFRCIDFMIFMQYVQNGVFKLQKDTVAYLLKRLDDSPENMQKKLFLIGHLSKSEGEELLADTTQTIGCKFYSRKRARENLINKDSKFPTVEQYTEQDVETLFPFVDQTELAIDANNFT